MTTKELDRRFRHVGRIKRAWGTSHKPTIRAMEQMMDGLFQRGRLDILRSLRDKTYTPLEVYDAWRVNELERLPTAATLAPLKETMTKWIAKKECSEAHKRSLAQSLRHLCSSGQRSTHSTVADLPRLLTGLRDSFLGSHPRSFNLARAAAQAFAKTTAGRNSKLWQDISAIEVLRVTPQRRKNPISPKELAAVTKRMSVAHSCMVWDMAYTGMGPSEYWGKWEYDQPNSRVVIHGTKRAGRERFVPAFIWVSGPSCEYAAFRRALRDASKGQLTPYDLRRSYANWLESAGIPRTRRRLYMGHGARDITDIYEWHEVQQFLSEDAERLCKFVSWGAKGKKALRLEKA